MTTYLSKDHISCLKPSWKELTSLIEKALITLNQGDFAQPIKPYLRYHDPQNRIIAMPAFVGGSFNCAGIKWIASFPENIKLHLPRAHSLTILNDYRTGKPLAVLSSSELSGLRTAAVSGYVIQRLADKIPVEKLKVGITGFGPIGQLHAEMVLEILKDRIKEICIFDVNPPQKKSLTSDSCNFVKTWQDAYLDADIFISCTTSKERYINRFPKEKSLQLNVSLRDYFPNIVMQSSCIVVDDWDEVCRENTDIEKASHEFGLKEINTIPLKALINQKTLESLLIEEAFLKGYISFHFMGMAAFDIALSSFFYEMAVKKNIGIVLPD